MKINYNVTDMFCEDEVARKKMIQKKMIEIICSKRHSIDGVVISLSRGYDH